jgi:hypothetical protein
MREVSGRAATQPKAAQENAKRDQEDDKYIKQKDRSAVKDESSKSN